MTEKSMYGWLDRLAEGKVVFIEASKMKEELEFHGFDFQELTSEDLETLSKYTNAAKGPIVTKVLGKVMKNRFKSFFDHMADVYRTSNLAGKEDADVEGLKALVYESIAYAANAYTWERLETNLNARLYNWGKKKKAQRFHIVVPGYNTTKQVKKGETIEIDLPFAPASFPPEYATRLKGFFMDLLIEYQ